MDGMKVSTSVMMKYLSGAPLTSDMMYPILHCICCGEYAWIVSLEDYVIGFKPEDEGRKLLGMLQYRIKIIPFGLCSSTKDDEE